MENWGNAMKKYSLMVAGSAISLALCAAVPAFAQDATEEPAAEETEESVDDAAKTTQEGGDKIVVTGSRIKKDTFSSVSPIQVLTTQEENEAGLFDPSQILQRSESAAGQQIDATFQGFVLDNGPGSQTLNLRGLGADLPRLGWKGPRPIPRSTFFPVC
jgi:iron complex outermembrane recepter protein